MSLLRFVPNIKRTGDVSNDLNASVDFRHLLLSEPIQKSLDNAGFHKPSPVQLKAIPVALSSVNDDLIIQAKSGTGKTLVFGIAALELLIAVKLVNLKQCSPAVLILAPTREVAVQIGQVICDLGKYLPDLKVGIFIGGDVVSKDIQFLRRNCCHIAIGTPGRLEQLIFNGELKLTSLRMIVIDEFDTEGFLDKIEAIVRHERIPRDEVQLIACSATISQEVIHRVKSWMRKSQQEIMLNPAAPSLEGVRQFYIICEPLKKWEALLDVLAKVPFHQCVVFSNSKSHAEDILSFLDHSGWPALYIAGGMEQHQRNKAISRLKSFQIRVLVSTDVIARGVDVEKVTLVINLDLPRDKETYLHRVGRTGRFGSMGTAVSIVSEQELEYLTSYASGTGSILKPFDASAIEEAKDVVAERELTEHEQKQLIKMKTSSFHHKKTKKKRNKQDSDVPFPWNMIDNEQIISAVFPR
eukprot:TRINITY_DN37882_c0_g1_i5.p1 TRINITY_DN37882_c0_g1~~TRINITY_DN37882_c0_g1_i5.p1  ORF type:complete len:468 (+),score=107.59 TRINITY_DN37882_c0_g1_i5:1400-2803(+)